jgi:hypothetical protein
MGIPVFKGILEPEDRVIPELTEDRGIPVIKVIQEHKALMVIPVLLELKEILVTMVTLVYKEIWGIRVSKEILVQIPLSKVILETREIRVSKE